MLMCLIWFMSYLVGMPWICTVMFFPAAAGKIDVGGNFESTDH